LKRVACDTWSVSAALVGTCVAAYVASELGRCG